jgi:CARDB
MRRPVLGALIAAAVLTASVACALAAQSRGLKPGQATVLVANCHPSDVVAERLAIFNGQMRSVTGTKRMLMHFTLLERLGGSGSYKAVPLGDLKPWRRSKTRAQTFIYAQRVTALRDDGAYRMRVQFRWYGDHKTLLKTSTVRSRACRQPAPLPNLTVTSVTSTPAVGGRRTYSVTVANEGQGEAREVPVVLKVDGTVVGSSTVDLLPAQESSVVQIPGPACAFTVRAAADPKRRIAETDDTDNALTVPCAQATA